MKRLAIKRENCTYNVFNRAIHRVNQMPDTLVNVRGDQMVNMCYCIEQLAVKVKCNNSPSDCPLTPNRPLLVQSHWVLIWGVPCPIEISKVIMVVKLLT